MQALEVVAAVRTGERERVDAVRPRRDPVPLVSADEAAFERFFRDHHRDVYVFALHLVGERTQAEDIASDVLVKVFLRARHRRVDHPAAYLRRAVVNDVHSRWRRRQVERRWLERQRHDDAIDTGAFERVSDAELLTRALGRLAPRQRAAIVLRFYEDLSEADTAEVLGCSVGTVKSQVHRGIARLRELVGPDVLAQGMR